MDDAEAKRNCAEALSIKRQAGSETERALDFGRVLCKHLARDQDAGHRVLQFICEFQTADEVVHRESNRWNGAGFSKFDAPFCTDVAEKRLEWLSDKQLRSCCKRAQKYTKQVFLNSTEEDIKRIFLGDGRVRPRRERIESDASDNERSVDGSDEDSTCSGFIVKDGEGEEEDEEEEGSADDSGAASGEDEDDEGAAADAEGEEEDGGSAPHEHHQQQQQREVVDLATSDEDVGAAAVPLSQESPDAAWARVGRLADSLVRPSSGAAGVSGRVPPGSAARGGPTPAKPPPPPTQRGSPGGAGAGADSDSDDEDEGRRIAWRGSPGRDRRASRVIGAEESPAPERRRPRRRRLDFDAVMDEEAEEDGARGGGSPPAQRKRKRAGATAAPARRRGSRDETSGDEDEDGEEEEEEEDAAEKAPPNEIVDSEEEEWDFSKRSDDNGAGAGAGGNARRGNKRGGAGGHRRGSGGNPSRRTPAEKRSGGKPAKGGGGASGGRRGSAPATVGAYLASVPWLNTSDDGDDGGGSGGVAKQPPQPSAPADGRTVADTAVAGGPAVRLVAPHVARAVMQAARPVFRALGGRVDARAALDNFRRQSPVGAALTVDDVHFVLHRELGETPVRAGDAAAVLLPARSSACVGGAAGGDGVGRATPAGWCEGTVVSVDEDKFIRVRLHGAKGRDDDAMLPAGWAWMYPLVVEAQQQQQGSTGDDDDDE